MPVIPSVPYSQIRGELDTGDLFFFYGTSSAAVLIEDLEGAVGWPPYSHAGMVIKDGESLYL
jgi:cell wall-associated NlpC family hydrolase